MVANDRMTCMVQAPSGEKKKTKIKKNTHTHTLDECGKSLVLRSELSGANVLPNGHRRRIRPSTGPFHSIPQGERLEIKG